VGAVVIQPLVVDPLFNRFEPLRDQHLKARILALAERAGIPGRNVYQVDKSRQTKTFNAYVNGFGVSQRIVLWDTTLQGMEEDEILFVMAHEMGHYKLAHIWKGILESTIGGFAFFWIVAIVARAGVRRFGNAWRFQRLDDPASLPWLLTLISLVAFLSQPIVNGFSRAVESEADVYALEITHDNDAGARTYLKLAAQNKSNPEPPVWIRFTLYSHPTLAERVRLALTYHPWSEGKPNKLYRPRTGG
jgi:Zn-dependent protease with chaperone function